jgi:mono/diheme cytochrome c family protein
MAPTRCIVLPFWSAENGGSPAKNSIMDGLRTPVRAVRATLCVVALLIAEATTAIAQDDLLAFTPREEQPDDYTDGAGREETFYTCTACHGFKIVAQQGMSRRQWNETIDLMIEKHNMPQPEEKDRETILNYLESTLAPRAGKQRSWQNPFLK